PSVPLLHPRPLRSALFPYTTLFRSADDLEALVEPLARGLHRDAEPAELGGLIAAAQAKFEPPAGEDVDLGPLLGDPQRVLERRRSEEHTSELQSRSDLVCRLLLEKK